MQSLQDNDMSEKLYDQVPLVDEDDEDGPIMENPMHHRSQKKSLRMIWRECIQAPKTLIVAGSLVTLCIFILTIASFTVHTPGSYVIFRTLSQQHSLQPDFVDAGEGPLELAGTTRCGSFPSQAVQYGCVFDLMNYGFTAPECFYEDLYEESLATGPWPWYIGENLTLPLPQDVNILMRSVEVWTQIKYHYEHCKYTQKIVARAVENDDILVPQEIARDYHREHCTDLVGRYEQGTWGTGEVMNTWIRMLYNPCVRLSDINKESIDFA
ncbi:hypothetical protein LSUB1_G001936 [Lachnellula subtilissima]|uniref:Uncharacterized protein n=1 Tax=Lachnellula subtilissima TaxID=602034 RepID=A0A8H8RWJ4_9HELO|nr:hypothetical protein LSUB1_G001936 [Lachnellula subtilissima]